MPVAALDVIVRSVEGADGNKPDDGGAELIIDWGEHGGTQTLQFSCHCHIAACDFVVEPREQRGQGYDVWGYGEATKVSIINIGAREGLAYLVPKLTNIPTK